MTKDERLKQDGLKDGQSPILFYRPGDTYGEFSNFSRHDARMLHPFTHQLTAYPTGEHRFQAMKAITAPDHDYVNAAPNPSDAKTRGREIKLCNHWGDDTDGLCWFVMVELCLAKARQHPAIESALLLTTTDLLYEDSPIDDIWGWRYRNNYSGKNLLGRAWMMVRGILEPRYA